MKEACSLIWTALIGLFRTRSSVAAESLRYPSDLTDAEWAMLAPMIPPAKRGGRPRDVNVREVLNSIFYVLSTGCQWKALPKDLPPKSTAHNYFMLWDWDGTLERIHHALYVAAREQAASTTMVRPLARGGAVHRVGLGNIPPAF
jgi:transposase